MSPRVKSFRASRQDGHDSTAERHSLQRHVTLMARNRTASFDPQTFLAIVGDGKTILEFEKHQTIFSQGDAADAVFYIPAGKVKLTVVSPKGKEAVVAVLGEANFFGEGCLAMQPVRMATATVMADSTIVRIGKSA